MRKVVYNSCFGGFGLSDAAIESYLKKKNKDYTKERGEVYSVDGEYFWDDEIERHDPDLVAVVEEMGEAANDSFSKLSIAQVSGLYRIEEYDGMESVIENYSDWK
jgi:hypothetical protein